jgi:hypothetical protein
MEKQPPKNQDSPLAEISEPAKDVKVWAKDGIRLLAGTTDGRPAVLDAVEASLLADRLRFLSEPDVPMPPYRAGETGFDALMHDICVEWGFCGCIKDGRPLHVTWFIPSRGPVRADQFVEWVFLADGLNPNSEPERRQKCKDLIRAAFIRHMGAEVVDAKQLRWSDCE